MIHLDPALGEELFDVAEGQAEAQVPADSDDDDIGREPESGEAERGGIDGRERSAILMTESHRTRRFTVNAPEPAARLGSGVWLESAGSAPAQCALTMRP